MASKFAVVIEWPDRKYREFECDGWTETIGGLSYEDAGKLEALIRREYRRQTTSVRIERWKKPKPTEQGNCHGEEAITDRTGEETSPERTQGQSHE